MTHTDTDIAEILQRFDERSDPDHKPFNESLLYGKESPLEYPESIYELDEDKIRDFITRECLALKKKWEREHFDNQDERR